MSQKSILVAVLAVLGAGVAQAAPAGIDGVLTVGEYDMPNSTVNYDPAAPEGNFGQPGASSRAVAYSIYLKSADGFVVGLLQADPSKGGAPAGPFANLYFDLDPQNPGGADLGFELGATSQAAFIPGGPGPVAQSNITVAVGGGGTVVEFAIPVASFTAPLPGLAYNPALAFPGDGGTIRLNLSQSFGYSVAGGQANFGGLRLGVTELEAAANVPEPLSVALLGAGLLGIGLVRRQG